MFNGPSLNFEAIFDYAGKGKVIGPRQVRRCLSDIVSTRQVKPLLGEIPFEGQVVRHFTLKEEAPRFLVAGAKVSIRDLMRTYPECFEGLTEEWRDRLEFNQPVTPRWYLMSLMPAAFERPLANRYDEIPLVSEYVYCLLLYYLVNNEWPFKDACVQCRAFKGQYPSWASVGVFDNKIRLFTLDDPEPYLVGYPASRRLHQ